MPPRFAVPSTVGPYELISPLGQGGMGSVYLARSRAGRLVAVKVIHAHLADDPDFRARFRREIASARRVSGAYTAPVLDADPDGSPPWFAAAYVPGPSLRDAVRRHGPLPEQTVRTLGAGLAEALAAVHAAGLVHRDLKPGNILLAADGPRLIDFGISRAVDDSALTATGVVLGSAGYMSPEQAAADRVEPASDVFSLGACLAFAATGRPPFGDGAVEALVYRVGREDPDMDGVPDPLRDLLSACLHRDPAQRPPVRQLPGLFLPGTNAPPASAEWLPEPVVAEVSARTDAVRGTATVADRRFGRRGFLIGGLAIGATVAAGAVSWAARGPRHRPRPSAQPTITLRRLWELNIAHDGPAMIAQGVLIFQDGFTLTGLDMGTGARRWSAGYPFPGAPRPLDPLPVAAAGDTLYTPVGSLVDAPGLRVLDVTTGEVRASIRAGQDIIDRVLGVRGSLVFCHGTGDNDEALVAIDTDARSARWRIPHQHEDQITVPPSGGLVFRTDASGTVHAHTATDGTERWRARTDASVAKRPLVIDADTVYATGAYLYALDAATGSQRWAFAGDPDNDVESVTVRNGTVYVDEPKISAIDAKTGALRWQAEIPGIPLGPLTINGGLVISPYGKDPEAGLSGWDPTTGTPRWRYVFPATRAQNPYTYVAAAGNRFAVSYGTLIIAFQA
ncbi:PQQ-binding-like beta-propeller repeat protein [Actinoallomurus sp. NPDC050550]|uniref:protein kinase domain-containing protein n=1 Tax=Actinoallomurus sp. NPDC050550 TaxID=3154937 RepID=UPI00340BFF63